MRRRDLIALSPLLALSPIVAMTGCSSTPAPVVEKKPPEPVTGLHALYGTYQQARQWAPDVMVVGLQSIALSQIKAQPGKAAAWQATFSSQSLSQKRAYTFSVFDASPSLRQGIFPDGPTALSSDTRPFVIAGARIDTDQAWETALKHGEEFSKKYPDMPISYTLELSRTINEPVWRVIWGENASSSSFSVVVDASTGLYVQTLH
jgi:hypothetical protein